MECVRFILCICVRILHVRLRTYKSIVYDWTVLSRVFLWTIGQFANFIRDDRTTIVYFCCVLSVIRVLERFVLPIRGWFLQMRPNEGVFVEGIFSNACLTMCYKNAGFVFFSPFFVKR